MVAEPSVGDSRGMDTTAGTSLPDAMRASDADRDAVLADLSAHFQAGRLTADELDERTGQALAARTWGQLKELLADLPAGQTPAGPSAESRPRIAAVRGRRRPAAALIGIGIVAVVLINAAHAGWGLLWLLVPVLIITRRLTFCSGGPRHQD
jgi:hypothetical protein